MLQGIRSTTGIKEWAWMNDVGIWNAESGHCGLKKPWFHETMMLSWLSKEDMVAGLSGLVISDGLRELEVPRLHVEDLCFRLLDPNKGGKLPARGTTAAAGYDLYCSEETVVQYGVISRIPTNVGLAWEWPHYIHGKIEDKSGLALKSGITNLGGRVDGDYRWNGAAGEEGKFEIGVIQTCLIPGGVKVYAAGDKVAQITLQKLYTGKDRVGGVRSGGFGSTGTK